MCGVKLLSSLVCGVDVELSSVCGVHLMLSLVWCHGFCLRCVVSLFCLWCVVSSLLHGHDDVFPQKNDVADSLNLILRGPMLVCHVLMFLYLLEQGLPDFCNHSCFR